jgi:DNA polymerase-3 subunit epsilon
MRQIILDTETTGLYHNKGDRIIEIGCIELIDRKFTGNNLHLYINPDRPSHPEALAIHGLTAIFLGNKPKFSDVSDQIHDFLLDADEVIAHNAKFDMGFLDMEFALAGCNPVASICKKVVDSLALAKGEYPGKKNSLDALCERLGVKNSHRDLHGALLDAELLANVYLIMTRNQDTLLTNEIIHNNQINNDPISNDDIVVIAAQESDIEAHNSIMEAIYKECGITVWKSRKLP